MNLEQLNAALASGEITQAEYDAKVANLNNEGGDKGGDNKGEFDLSKFMENEDFKKLIQSEVDKVRTKYSTDKKNMEKELNDLRTKNMTKEEILLEKENSLKEFEAQIKKQDLDFQTYKLLSEKKVDNKFFDYVKGDTVEERKESLDRLILLLDEQAALKAEAKFKSQGRDHNDSNDDNKDKKWEDMSIDEKIKFANDNPEASKQFLKR